MKTVVVATTIGLALLLVFALPGLLRGNTDVTSGLVSPAASNQARLRTMRQQRINSCEPVINAMKPAPNPVRTVDPVDIIRQLKLAALPIVLNSPTRVVARALYRTFDQYINDSAIPNVQQWQDLMKADDFKVGASVDFAAGPDHWNAVALDFGSPSKAADFQRTSIGAFCSLGLIRGLHQIPGLPGSFTLTRLDPGTSPYRALLLVGSSVVHLNLCSCVETRDPIALVSRWATVVARQLGVKPRASQPV